VPIPQFYPGYATAGQPGQTGAFGGSTSATYKTVGVNLEIDKAKVTATDEVTMEFKAEFSLIGEDKVFGTGANQVNYPQFLTRKLENTIRMSDGVTAVIGGLLQGRDARSLKGALGLESIPVLNKILGGQTRRDEEIEILISLTPHILRAPNILPEDVDPLYLGLRNNLRIPGVRPLFGPEEVAPEPESPAASRPSEMASSPSPAAPVTPTPSAVPFTDAEPDSAPPGNPVPEGPVRASSPAPPAGAPDPSLSAAPPLASRAAWDRTEVQMKLGEVQRVAVNLFNARSLKEVAITVRADSAVIEFVEIGPGQLLSVDGAQVLSERQLEGTRASAQLRRATPLAGGTGSVAFIGFRAVRSGEVTIFVESLFLSSGSGQSPVPLAGAVRVTVMP
jgi:general secretion pathway protein D